MAPPLTPPLSRKRFAFLAADGVEEASLAGPWRVLEAGGALPELVSTGPAPLRTTRGLDFVGSRRPDVVLEDELEVEEYTGLVLPGGLVSVDVLRRNPRVTDLVRAFFSAAKPVAAVGHAVWLIVEAGLANGKLMTAAPSLRTDIRNAGGRWSDEPVVVHRSLVTAQGPSPAFDAAVREHTAAGVAAENTRLVETQKEEVPS